MPDHGKLLTNIFFSSISWLSSLIYLVILILAARLLGNETYGQFAFAFSLVALFEVIADVGMRTYLIRELARSREKTGEILANILALKTGLAIPTIIILVGLALFMDLASDVRLSICLLTLAMISKSFKLMWRGILIAHEQFQREALIVVLDRGFLLLACTVALVLSGKLLPFVGAYCGASIFSMGLTYLMTDRSLRRPRWSVSWSKMGSILKSSLPFGLTTAAFMVYLRLDSVMLSVMRNDAEVGLYNAAYHLMEGLIIVPMIVQYVIYPRVSVLHLESKVAVQALVKKSCKYLIAAGLPIAVVGIFVADPVIQLIYGLQYAPAADALQILLAGITFMFLTNILRNVLNAVNRPHIALVGGLFGVAVNVALNFYLIPRYGYLGTSLSTLIAELFLFALIAIDLRRQGYKFGLARSFVKPGLALVPCIFLMLALQDWNFPLLVLAGLSAYTATLLLVRFLEPDELAELVAARERLLLTLTGK